MSLPSDLIILVLITQWLAVPVLDGSDNFNSTSISSIESAETKTEVFHQSSRKLRLHVSTPGLLDTLGFVGEPAKVDTTVLDQVLGRELIPVLAPVAQGADGETYNVNADTFAGAIAGALRAKRLLFLTDVPGVLDRNKQLIKELRVDEIRGLIADGTITGGMIPKVETCIDAVEGGVDAAVILDGRTRHAILLELFINDGAGTLIRSGEA